jgi:hypothetical protein
MIPRYRPTEPPDQFASLRKELEQEIQPEGVIERTYVHDLAYIIWEIRCLRHYKTHIINSSRNEALEGILRQLLCRDLPDDSYDTERREAAEDLCDQDLPDDSYGTERQEAAEDLCDLDFPDDSYGIERREAAEDLARRWFEEDAEAKTEVGELLHKFQMDEGTIEAEAFMIRLDDIERLNLLQAALEFRRDKALSCVAGYRQMFSKRLKQTTDRVLDNDEVPRLTRMGRTTKSDNGKHPAD